MSSQVQRCPYCGRQFLPSSFRPSQRVCFSPDCRRRRRADYHRRKYQSDPLYRQICQDSRRKWRARNPDYQRHYRSRHPGYVDGNRRAQRRRDRKRRMRDLVKNNLAFDLKRCSADVWLAGPAMQDLVKNNLAISQVMIFQTVGSSPGHPG